MAVNFPKGVSYYLSDIIVSKNGDGLDGERVLTNVTVKYYSDGKWKTYVDAITKKKELATGMLPADTANI